MGRYQRGQAVLDYERIFAAIEGADGEAKEVLQIMRGRIDAEKEEAAAKIAERERVSNDRTRTETARRMAAAELDRLRQQEFLPSTEEADAFWGAMARYELALRDATTMRAKLNDLFSEAKQALEEDKRETYKHDIELTKRAADNLKDNFARAAKG